MSNSTLYKDQDPIYEDPEVDAYYRQMRSPAKGIETPFQIIGSILTVALMITFLFLNVSYLLRNR